MTQKVNSKQLKEIYFNPPSSIRSFHEPSKYSKMRNSNQSFLAPKKDYLRYSEEEIARFEKFFNKHYYHPPTETDVPISTKQTNMDFSDLFEPLVSGKHLEKEVDSDFDSKAKTVTYKAEPVKVLNHTVIPMIDAEGVSQISQLEKDLIEQSTGKSETCLEGFTLEKPTETTTAELFVGDEIEQVKSPLDEQLTQHQPPKAEIDDEDEKIDDLLDDELIYLENLVANGGNGIAAASLGSLGNLLDEIVDNEKHHISNYETDVFNANIQLLLDTDPEADLLPIPQPPEVSQAISDPQLPEGAQVISAPQPPPVPQAISTLPVPPAPPVISNDEEVDNEQTETEVEPHNDPQQIEPNETVTSENLKGGADVLIAKIDPLNHREDSHGLNHSDTEKETRDNFTDFLPNEQLRKKKPRLDLFDMILIILILMIVGFLLFYFRHLLPFMNRI